MNHLGEVIDVQLDVHNFEIQDFNNGSKGYILSITKSSPQSGMHLECAMCSQSRRVARISGCLRDIYAI